MDFRARVLKRSFWPCLRPLKRINLLEKEASKKMKENPVEFEIIKASLHMKVHNLWMIEPYCELTHFNLFSSFSTRMHQQNCPLKGARHFYLFIYLFLLFSLLLVLFICNSFALACVLPPPIFSD
jgi:hypothetical protein